MKLKGTVLSVVFSNAYFTRFIVKAEGSNDTFLLSAKNDVYSGAIGETYDLEIECSVSERERDEEKFVWQQMFIKTMSKCS